jgi:hypothetical protein
VPRCDDDPGNVTCDQAHRANVRGRRADRDDRRERWLLRRSRDNRRLAPGAPCFVPWYLGRPLCAAECVTIGFALIRRAVGVRSARYQRRHRDHGGGRTQLPDVPC